LQQEFLNLLSARQGHFRYESGYHSDLWLDLDLLFLRPNAVQPFTLELARKLTRHKVSAVCGPLVGGALVAQMVASELDVEFYYTERYLPPQHDGLYPVQYKLPNGLRKPIQGKDVAILDDVISAGSAVRGTLTELRTWGIGSAVIGALLVLGSSAPSYFAEQKIPVESIAHAPNNLWLPAECPLCRSKIPLEDITADSSRFPPNASTKTV
jgi:orotate phosphoribosyltransferase